MGIYKPVLGANGVHERNPDGSLRMAAQRRDPTTAEVREVLRRQHMMQTQQRMQRSGEQRPYFTPAPAAPAPPAPPPTAEQMAASQTPLPQAAPVAPPVEAPLPVGTIDEEIEKAKALTNQTSEPAETVKKTPKKKRKASKQKNLPRRQCEWEGCDKGNGGLQMVFQPYRKYEKYCCTKCRELARKKKAKDKYQEKKKAAAAAQSAAE